MPEKTEAVEQGELSTKDLVDLLDQAWGVIANAGMCNGGWDYEHPEWVEAAERWRDRWHEVLAVWCRRPCSSAPDRAGWNLDGSLICTLPGGHAGNHQSGAIFWGGSDGGRRG